MKIAEKNEFSWLYYVAINKSIDLLESAVGFDTLNGALEFMRGCDNPTLFANLAVERQSGYRLAD